MIPGSKLNGKVSIPHFLRSTQSNLSLSATADPRCYHGDLRISTGLALLHGLNSIIPYAAHVKVPLRIVHGSNDRVTDHTRSIEFVDAVIDAGHVHDVTCEIYEGYEHLMLKVGVDAQDDEKRQRVLRDMESWFVERV